MNNNKAFTLIELSIVLVIIGLIVAGVIGGQSLVKQAQLRSVISESEQVKVAFNAFKLEYNAIPGDMMNASQYWATGCNAAGTGASVAAECDGNGDRRLSIAAANTSEGYMAWKHLELSNLFSGTYAPSIAVLGDIGVNIPSSKFPSAGITLVQDTNTAPFITAGNGSTVAGDTRNTGKNVMFFGGEVAGNVANQTLFSPAQLLSIDSKVDDSNPTSGSVMGTGTTTEGAATCLASADNYNLDSTSLLACGLVVSF